MLFPRLVVTVFACRYDSHSGGEKEIQRTMLELLNQLDGFDSRGDVKVIMATNKIESLGENSCDPLFCQQTLTTLGQILHCSALVELIERLNSPCQTRRPNDAFSKSTQAK